MVFKKIIFQNRYVELETTPAPPFMEKTILNFHFDYLTPSLSDNLALLENIFRIRMFSKAPESRDGDS